MYRTIPVLILTGLVLVAECLCAQDDREKPPRSVVYGEGAPTPVDEGGAPPPSAVPKLRSGEGQPTPAEIALEQLQKCADSFYTQQKAKVTRIACFVQAPEIFKVQQYRSRYILEKVDYEMIWEEDKPITVKPRDIPPYFGWEAKAEAELYAKAMAAQLQEFSKITNMVQEIIRQITVLQKTERYEIKSSAEGKLQKIELFLKDSEKPKRPRSNRKGRGAREEDKDVGGRDSLPDSITLWLNVDFQITRLEILGAKEKVAGTVMPVKYNKMWNIGQMDVTTYKVKWPEKDAPSEDDSSKPLPPSSFDFKERTRVAFTYAHPVDKVMAVSNLQITKLDSEGKTLARRNEPNPVNVSFTKHEVEKSK
ncbi:MAG: hypothetical protein AB1599_00030 [Planctomycetota bacterium]